jgi:hypothetical protein
MLEVGGVGVEYDDIASRNFVLVGGTFDRINAIGD